jgi:hypothetical protein
MATQKGIIKIKGTVGDLTFYKTTDGHILKEKTSISSDRIKNDPAFSRTRENNKEFGAAGKAAKLLRDAIRPLLQQSKDRRVTSRLSKEMLRVIKADATSTRGERNVIDGELELLTGFDFNLEGKLGTILFAPFTVDIDRVSGVVTFQVPSFKPSQMVSGPGGATHFKIVSAAAELDFENAMYVNSVQRTTELPWDETATAVITQEHDLTANSTHPIVLIAGIQFMQEVNGNMYPLKTGAFNALNLVKVNGV